MIKTEERTQAGVAPRAPDYHTLLVHAEPGAAAVHRVEIAAALARHTGARLIGLGAETFDPTPTPDPFSGYAAGEWVALVQEQIGKNLKAAETAFRRDAEGADIEWRTVQDYPHLALIRAAKAADLILMSPMSHAARTSAADPADVVMGAGRPVLIVPKERRHLHANAVVVAWKDTRECRRALSDAMPFLTRADDVVVLAVCKPDTSEIATIETADVVANLKRHGVAARAMVVSAAPDGVPAEILRVARVAGADLVVAGAYGHSRLREWAFGGVTDDFLHRPDCFVLMSH